jgi:hypothetical protein
MLLANLYLLTHLPLEKQGTTITRWLDEVTKETPGLTAFLLLTLTALILQSVAFPLTQSLQGYWGHSALSHRLALVCVHRQLRRRTRLRTLHDRVAKSAFEKARIELLALEVPPRIVDLLEADVLRKPTPNSSDDEMRTARALDWRVLADACDLARLDAASDALMNYPEKHRILPTRLGNTLRAAEDLAFETASLSTAKLLNRFDQLPAALQQDHDRHRRRMYMSCSLVAVFGFLAILIGASVPVFHNQYQMRFALTGVYLALAFISYQAATSHWHLSVIKQPLPPRLAMASLSKT